LRVLHRGALLPFHGLPRFPGHRRLPAHLVGRIFNPSAPAGRVGNPSYPAGGRMVGCSAGGVKAGPGAPQGGGGRWATSAGWRGWIMLQIKDRLRIPEDEFQWQFVRSGGPGGQNVNKVASKAVLRWDVANSPSVPEPVKARLRTLQRRRITAEGELVLSSQR